MPKLKVHAAILCEDVRREASGKAILIGASNRGPSLNADGETVLDRLAFYVEAEVVDAESIRVRFRSVETDKNVFLEDLNFPYKEDVEDVDFSEIQVHLQLVISVQEVKFDAPGKYALEYSFDDDEWITIREYQLSKRDSAKQDD